MSEPGATAEGLKLAFAYLLTTRGTPEIYYGDEIGMTGGDDPENRHDFPAGDHSDNEIFRYVQKLLQIRAQLEPLRKGTLTSVALDSKTWVYAREYKSEKVLVALNNSGEAAEIDVSGSIADGEDYSPVLLPGNPLPLLYQLQLGKNQQGVISLPAHSAAIFNRISRK
jgi:glycosidase